MFCIQHTGMIFLFCYSDCLPGCIFHALWCPGCLLQKAASVKGCIREDVVFQHSLLLFLRPLFYVSAFSIQKWFFTFVILTAFSGRQGRDNLFLFPDSPCCGRSFPWHRFFVIAFPEYANVTAWAFMEQPELFSQGAPAADHAAAGPPFTNTVWSDLPLCLIKSHMVLR